MPLSGVPASAEAIFRELSGLADVSPYARAIYKNFLEHDCVYATLKVDLSAAVDAGHVSLTDEPGESLVVCLLAMRAVKAQEDIFFNRAHEVSPEMIESGLEAFRDFRYDFDDERETVRNIFLVMLDVAIAYSEKREPHKFKNVERPGGHHIGKH